MPDIAPPRPDSLLGGRYRLVRRCGIGGMGEVWEAEDTVLERRVAVKLVTGDQRHDPAVLARFEREARTGARLVHPNLATVYDYGEADEGAYLVMELLAGETLAERLHRGPLPATEAAAVVAEAAEALAVAHAAGVTHRDVKPSNLMLTGDGTKVMDFGIASGEGEPLTATGLVIGTADYLAPERARGQTSGPAADVYALGAVLVEAITGASRAFRGETPADVARAQVHAEPPDLRPMADVPTHIADAAAATLAKDPSARPSTITLAARLRDPGASVGAATTVAVASASAPTTTFPPVEQPAMGPPAGGPPRSSGRGPWPIVLGVLLLLAVAAGAGLLLTDDGEESDRPTGPCRLDGAGGHRHHDTDGGHHRPTGPDGRAPDHDDAAADHDAAPECSGAVRRGARRRGGHLHRDRRGRGLRHGMGPHLTRVPGHPGPGVLGGLLEQLRHHRARR